jgi:hypothetical protein
MENINNNTLEKKSKNCPTCNYLHDDHTCLNDDDQKPTKDDLTICFNCGELLIFVDDLYNKRIVTEQETEEMYLDEETKAMIKKTQQRIRSKRQ